MTLKSRLGVTQEHWKWHHSIRVPICLPLKLWAYLVSIARKSEVLVQKC